MRNVILLLLIIIAAPVSAQRVITGTLVDGDTGKGMGEATVQLLRGDSTFVTGSLSDDNGIYSVKAPSDGQYTLKITSVGYKTLTRRVAVSGGKDVKMPKLTIKPDAIMLEGATVTGQAAKVVLKEDTFVYNTSAYRLPEGSVAEDLVKKIPGAEVSDDGTITVNGKQIKKILVDGKEFMTGDTKTAMKNLPTSIIEKVKAYDKQSDLARVSGIDDGEEEAVLDFGIKKGMNKGSFGEMDFSLGNHSRYSEKLMGAYYNDKFRIMGFGNANNVNDRGFGGGGRGWFGGMNGLNQQKMAGVNFNYEQKDKLQIDGSVRWNHSDGDTRSISSKENFVSLTGSFSNSISQKYTRSNSWDFRGRLEWQPDTMTDIMFRPSIQLSKTDGLSSSSSASYNSDPYNYTSDPLSDEGIALMAADSVMVNTNRNTSISYGDSKSASGTLQINRRLSSNGRNVTLRVGGNWGKDNSETLSLQDVHLYQILNQMGLDSTYQKNRYNITPQKSFGYSLRATYSEPIARKTYLQLSYQMKYSQTKSDRSTYDFSNLGEDFFSSVSPAYRSWGNYTSLLDNPIDYYLDDDLSRYSKYQTWTHEIQLMFRMNREKYRLNAGIMLQPQRSHYIQDYQGVHVDTTRTVFNWSPTLDFRYRFSKVSNLRINYRGTTTQPSMSQLLDIVDDSDPLNISRGNPGLKPAFTQALRLFYNNYIQSHNRSLMTFVNFSTTSNSISNKVTYDDKTGGRTTRPENINGNWSARGAFMFNTSIDSAGVWNVNTFTGIGYNHYVSYLNLNRNTDSEKNVTKNMTIGERLSASYRISWLELELNGTLNYQHSRNALQQTSNLDTWQYAYGGSVSINLPWNMTLNTNLSNQSRRGYNDASMNTNELIWNAQISQSFLRGKKLSVMLQFFDILHQQSNISRTISAMMRSDTEYNNINSYAMLHVTYQFSLFGGKAARDQQRGMGPGGRPMGPPPGNYGGGRRGGGFGGPSGRW